MTKWKVSYIDIDTRKARYPFFKWTQIVESENRKEAIAKVMEKFSPPKYGEFKASKTKDGEVDF